MVRKFRKKKEFYPNASFNLLLDRSAKFLYFELFVFFSKMNSTTHLLTPPIYSVPNLTLIV